MPYRVTWTIDIYCADDPVSAAVRAFAHMQRHGTTANVFDVQDNRCVVVAPNRCSLVPHGHATRVDLKEALEENPPAGATLDAVGRAIVTPYLLEVGDGVSQRQPRTWGPYRDTLQARREGRQMREASPGRSLELVTVAITPRELLVERLPTIDPVDD